MSATPNPQLLVADIERQVAELFDLECPPSELPEFKVRQIRRRIEEVARHSRTAADQLLASLLTIEHRYEEARAALANAEANGDRPGYLRCMLRLESNFLYAASTFEIIPEVLDTGAEPNYRGLFESAVAVGAFRLVCQAVEHANRDQRVIVNASNLISLSRAAAPVLDHYGLTDADIAACVDEAGEVLRAAGLLWLGTRPDVHVAGLDADEPGVGLEYRVPVTTAEAAVMNDRLVDRLVEKDLFKPGFALGFTGVRP